MFRISQSSILQAVDDAKMTFFSLSQLEESLRKALEPDFPEPTRLLHVAVPVIGTKDGSSSKLADADREEVPLISGERTWAWQVSSLRGLFRGDRPPPPLGDTPTAYERQFSLLDLHALEISRIVGPRRDAEMEEIYSALRRRPDGRSLGKVHDYMWRAAALTLGAHPLSQAEFEAILGRLERSCRRFGRGPTSWNYVASLEQTFGRVV